MIRGEKNQSLNHHPKSDKRREESKHPSRGKTVKIHLVLHQGKVKITFKGRIKNYLLSRIEDFNVGRENQRNSDLLLGLKAPFLEISN